MSRNKTYSTDSLKTVFTKPVVNQQVVPIPSLTQTMKEGFGLGVGLSVGRNIVDGVFNMFSTPKSSNPSENKKIAEYEKCLEYSSNDIDKCKSLLNN